MRFHSVAALALVLCSAVPPSHLPPGAVQVGGCSGTLVHRALGHTYGVSAAHCSGKAGTEVYVILQSGSRVKGSWVAADAKTDLALFKIPSSGQSLARVVAAPPVIKSVTAYGRHGPKQLKATGPREIRDTTSKQMFMRRGYKVSGGKYRDGDSGAGVYAGGNLIGVASHGKDDKELFSSSHAPLVAFLKEHKAFGPRPEGSDWGDKDRTREILELKRRLAELEPSQGKTGPAGPAGPAGGRGDTGPAGPPGTASDTSDLLSRLESLEDWRSNFRATIRIRLRPVKE